MKICYLSGPMRGYPDFNYPAFHVAASALRENGWHVHSPAEMDGLFGTAGNDVRRYVRRDLHILVNELDEDAAVVVLPGWEQSLGATAEVAVAKWCKLRVLTIAEALRVGDSHSSTSKSTEYKCPVS